MSTNDSRNEDNDNITIPGGSIKRKMKGFFRQLIVVVVIFAIGFVSGIVVVRNTQKKADKKDDTEPVTYSIATTSADIAQETESDKEAEKVTIKYVEDAVKGASDLVSTKYIYKDADTYENIKKWKDIELPWTKNQSVFTYRGTISLGIDIQKIIFTVDDKAKTITASMPEVKIVANEIDADSFEVYDVHSSVFNKQDMKDYTDLISDLKKKKAEKVMDDEELKQNALNNSEQVIRNLINATKLARDYQVIFQ